MIPVKFSLSFSPVGQYRSYHWLLFTCSIVSSIFLLATGSTATTEISPETVTSETGVHYTNHDNLDSLRVSAGFSNPPSPTVSPALTQTQTNLQFASSEINIPSTPTLVAQASSFPDVQGHWAQAFIETLAGRGIIEGFPDGTFRPNAPVTRAQYAAIIRQAFQRNPIRTGTQFVDVPTSYWAYNAIQEAYRTGFLAGFPNNRFLPDQNIPRVQALVAIESGLDLPGTANTALILNQVYRDAAIIPDYARASIADATENQIVVNYPNVNFLNPNQIATRADVAAFIYQALVRTGRVQPILASNPVSQYIVGLQPVATPPTTPPPTPTLPPLTADALRENLLLREPLVERQFLRAYTRGSSIQTPTAIGLDDLNGFASVGFQGSTRTPEADSDGAFAFGLGVGDARELVGVEGVVSVYDLDDPFDTGGVSFKVHKLLSDSFGVAVGVENAIDWGDDSDADSSVYGVATKAFALREDIDDPFSSLIVSVGVGGGRFRSPEDVEADEETINFFASAGLKVIPEANLIAEWSGQDLNVGASIQPFSNIPLVITPAIVDIFGNAEDAENVNPLIDVSEGPRFVLGVSIGFDLN